MNRDFLYSIAMMLFAASSGFGQETSPPKILANTLQEKIKSYGHLGLRIKRNQLEDSVIYLFTDEQFKTNREAKQKLRFISKRITEARNRNANRKEIAELESQREKLIPRRWLLASISLYHIKHVGKDFVELVDPDDKSSITIIPLSKIATIRISKNNFAKSK